MKNYRICRFGQGNRDVNFHIFKGKAVLKVVDATVIFSLAVQACFEGNSYSDLSILSSDKLHFHQVNPGKKTVKIIKVWIS